MSVGDSKSDPFATFWAAVSKRWDALAMPQAAEENAGMFITGSIGAPRRRSDGAGRFSYREAPGGGHRRQPPSPRGPRMPEGPFTVQHPLLPAPNIKSWRETLNRQCKTWDVGYEID